MISYSSDSDVRKSWTDEKKLGEQEMKQINLGRILLEKSKFPPRDRSLGEFVFLWIIEQ